MATALPYWVQRLRAMAGGEQTNPDNPDNQPTPTPTSTSTPPPDVPDDPHPVYSPPAPTSSHPAEQTQPWTPPTLPVPEDKPSYGGFWEWVTKQPGFERATAWAPYSPAQQGRVGDFITSLTSTLDHDLPQSFRQDFAKYISGGSGGNTRASEEFVRKVAGMPQEPDLASPAWGETEGEWTKAGVGQGGQRQAKAEDISSRSDVLTYLSPLREGEYYITEPYGYDPNYPGKGDFHYGLDYGTNHKPINFYIPASGTVESIGQNDGYGLALTVRLQDGTTLLFGHLSASNLKVGDSVQAGELGGITGGDNGDWRDGTSTGWHLHFGVMQNGKWVDPQKWLGEEHAPFKPPTEPPNGHWTPDDAIHAIRYWSDELGYSDAFKEFALAVSAGETGGTFDPYTIGDSGESHGIYQLYSGGRAPMFYSKYGEDADINNPYLQAEFDLPYIHAAFEKYGGDAAWASDPATTLKNGWHYGQGSVWPTGDQIAAALKKVAELRSGEQTTTYPSAPTPSTPQTQPTQRYTEPTSAPSLPFQRMTPFERMAPWQAWLAGTGGSGLAPFTRQSPFGMGAGSPLAGRISPFSAPPPFPRNSLADALALLTRVNPLTEPA